MEVTQAHRVVLKRESVGLYCGENLTEEKKGEVNSSQTKQRERCQRSMGRALVHDHLLVHSEVTVTSELHAEVDAAAAKNKDMEKRRLHPFEALTKTLKWRMELKNGVAPLVADEIGCCQFREWVRHRCSVSLLNKTHSLSLSRAAPP